MSTHNALKRPLAVALAAALVLPGLAGAQTAKEAELEARVAELEKMVQQLLQHQQEAPAVAPAPAADPGKTIQSTTILPGANPGSRFSYGGFIKFDAMVTDTSDGKIADGSAGRLFYVPSTIPVVANGTEPDTDPYTDFHAAFSRFWFAVDHTTDNDDKFRGYIEADLFGGGSANLGNEVSTNTHGITIRHAFVTWNNWLAGQTWTNFQDLGSLPETVDFLGVSDGTIFVRQAQLRYTNGPWSFSIENPHTLATNFGGTGRFSSGDNVLPDITARWNTKGDWGHFSVAGLLRQFKAGDETATGASVSVAGKFNLGANDDIRYMANYGQGLGRYFAFGQGTDVVLDAGSDLEPINAYGGFIGWRHAFNPQLRSNIIFSAAYYDNDPSLTGWGVTERSHSIRANLIYSPFPKLDIGAEVTYGERALEDDREGDLKRFHTTVKYSF
ncbi:DcaP family trimeric outer membrane transporter [Marilutibacter alkalisoli]|uniref:Porin n=1 Tax=Marilutibacter alkalisoli TaxID=2591633 RepID=A0A514BVY9_9GAMM|nr:DcaP family trimeric outer membrane transporter [Lysobacter alkalisoli]QDH71547.1 hypothetical protein FKV23_16680 [Lysobacter alkalisoli]